MKILDASAGNRAMWINKQFPGAVYVDIRSELNPDVCADTTCLPFSDGEFDLVVFDPPHGNLGHNSRMAKRYGSLTHAQIKEMVRGSGMEFHRVTRPGSLMVLKWSDRDLSVSRILESLSTRWTPMFGHALSSNATRNHHVHWMLLCRMPDSEVSGPRV